MGVDSNHNKAVNNPDQKRSGPVKPTPRRYNRLGGRPGLNVDFGAVCAATQGALQGNGDTITDVATRFGVSRGWIWKWIYPFLEGRNAEPTDASDTTVT